MPRLGVNIDHVATIREARGTVEPDPLLASSICELAGCHSIVAHLRQDRRHINDRDVTLLRQAVKTRFNLEMSALKDIVDIACRLKPDISTLVPEKRKELTTEGGLDVSGQKRKIGKVTKILKKNGIRVSYFIDPDKSQIKASLDLGADIVEIHTGNYANAKTKKKEEFELGRICDSVNLASGSKLSVSAGHGLTYYNVKKIAAIPGIEELNIGHSIISRAVFTGLDKAVREMLALIT